MKNKMIIGASIAFLLVLTLVFPKSLSIDGGSSDYSVRISLGSIASNTSTSSYNAEIHSNQFSANLTSGNFQGGRLSILQYNIQPRQPELNLPRNDTYTTNNEINLSWSNTTDPNQHIDFDEITYILEVYNDSALTEIYYSNESIIETANTTEEILSILESNIILYWQIIATDGNLNSTASEVRVVTKDAIAPTSFNLLSPANNTETTDNTPSFEWEATTESNLDNYTLEFSTSSVYVNPNYTQYSTTNSFSNWTTQLAAATYYWKVIAYDKAGSSNESTEQRAITITAVTETVTTTVSTGESVTRSGGVKQKPFNLDIIAPPTVTIYSEDSVIVPLIVTNPANEIILRGINLNVTSESEDVAPALGTTYIQELRPKEQRQVPLTIVTHTNPGTYGITITANVVNPEFSDSVKIFANLIESDEDKSEIQSEKQLIFAQDLFNANPGCVELKEYLSQAEEEFKAGRYTKALNLADNAISSCKDLIAFIEEPKPQNVQTYLEKLKLNQTVLILIAESFAFLLTLFIAVKIIRRKK